MGNKKNIDRLFQKQFENFNESPNNSVWNKIKTDLEIQKKSQKRVIPFLNFYFNYIRTVK